jgi:hypothetical protein
MLVDHLALFAGVPLLRFTVGRLAVPLFFVLAGHLSARASWGRVWRLVGLGVLLQAVAPWSDALQVLGALGAGAFVLNGLRGRDRVLLVVLCLTLAANGWGFATSTAYDGLALFSLMIVGAELSRSSLRAVGQRLPSWLAWPGRHALGVYAVHIPALTVLAWAVTR